MQSVRNRVPFFGAFDWTQIHPQVDLLNLFQATYGDGRVPAVDVLLRPGALIDVSDGMARLLEDLRLAGEEYERQSEQGDRELVGRMEAYDAAKRLSEC